MKLGWGHSLGPKMGTCVAIGGIDKIFARWGDLQFPQKKKPCLYRGCQGFKFKKSGNPDWRDSFIEKKIWISGACVEFLWKCRWKDRFFVRKSQSGNRGLSFVKQVIKSNLLYDGGGHNLCGIPQYWAYCFWAVYVQISWVLFLLLPKI